MFKKEIDMSTAFKFFLESKLKNKNIDWEFELDGVIGIPDCIIFEKTKKNIKSIITIEFKLKNWKRALEQCQLAQLYSNMTMVVIGSQGLSAAKKNIEFFVKSNVGLAFFSDKGVLEIYYLPSWNAPISDIYTYLIYKKLVERNKLPYSKHKLLLWKSSKSDYLLNFLTKYKKAEFI